MGPVVIWLVCKVLALVYINPQQKITVCEQKEQQMHNGKIVGYSSTKWARAWLHAFFTKQKKKSNTEIKNLKLNLWASPMVQTAQELCVSDLHHKEELSPQMTS